MLIATGLAAAITESISMGAVAYTSFMSERDHYRAEEQRERDEVRTMPRMERQEIRDIYAQKGFRAKQLEMVVDTITADPEAWVSDMMAEELHLQEDLRTREIPVVMVSADATKTQTQRLLAAGARAYLTRSFEVRR